MIESPSSKVHSWTCGLISVFGDAGDLREAGHVDLVVEVADVGEDRLVLHLLHVRGGDDVEAARRGDDDVGLADDRVELGHLVAVHRGLQRADRVDLGDDDAGALAAQRLGAALAHVAVPGDDGDLAADEDVGRAVEAVDERVAAAVLVVELALGDRVVDVDRREEQLAGLGQLVEAVDARRGLLGDALDLGGDRGPLLRVLREGATDERLEDAELLGVVLGRGGHLTGGLPLLALVHEHRGVATVVEDHVGAGAAGPGEDLLGAVPVLLEGLALPGEDGHALGVLGGAVRAHDDRRGGLVLGGVDVAGGPADLGTERGERLDEHRGLHGHVQGPGDAGPGQRLAVAELGAQGHQPRHLVLGETDLVAAGLSQAEVADLVVNGHA